MHDAVVVGRLHRVAQLDAHLHDPLDGQGLSEKTVAAKYGVRFTPTFQFFGEGALKDLPPAKREVSRASGYMLPDDFLAMFRYVREKAYEGKSFRDYLRSRPS